jgi:uncharacterized membrane protein
VTTAATHAQRLRQARYAALGTAMLLALCVAAAALRSAPWPANLGWTIALLLPVVAPTPGIVRGLRRTYAWATLCVAPYFIYGITEVIANPAVRGAAAAILFASLAWFVALVWYLRVSARAPAGAQGSAGT